MKKLLVAGIAAATFLSAPALAGPPPSVFNWTGCYLGANAGGGWGKADPIGSDFSQSKPRGFVGGDQFGCDYQASNWVLGLQGDFSSSAARNSQFTSFDPFDDDNFSAKIEWLASATARLGYAWDRWLVYGKGGAAWVKDKLGDNGDFFIPVPLFVTYDFNGSVIRSGWTWGGGLQYGLTQNWSVGLEYDYYNFGTKTVTLFGSNSIGTGTSEPFPLKQNFSVAKVSLNYRFGTGN
jgi:outer membrane immunogenic protein